MPDAGELSEALPSHLGMVRDGDSGVGRGRRWFLKRAGLAAAAGTGVAALGPAEVSDATRPTAVRALDVRSFGARGDGATDDRAAIQAAFDAAAARSGGTVFLPPGDYVVSGPITPRSSTLIAGSHSPRYGSDPDPPSACKIRARRDFDGDGLVVGAPEARGVTLRNLALVGDGAGRGVHGIRMPDDGEVEGEQGWSLDGVTIAGFSGDGIHGRVWVWTIAGSHIHDNAGWGIDASGGDSWTDAYVHDTMIYFNRSGGVRFDGSGVSGLVHFVNCRFERSGGRASDPGSPYNPSAPGVRLTSGKRLLFANCSTDANMGNGFEVEAVGDLPVTRLAGIHVVNCSFGRDGTGDQREQGEFAGVKISGASSAVATHGANEMTFSNCTVTTGKAADDESGQVVGPKYGVWFENTRHFQWVGGFVAGETAPFHTGRGGNDRPTLVSVAQGMATLPLDRPAAAVDGMTYVDQAAGRLMVRVGGAWRSTPLR